MRPTWRPVLSEFCKELTGITQVIYTFLCCGERNRLLPSRSPKDQVDSAHTFSEILPDFEAFMIKNGLIDESGATLARFCFCTDGPFDIPSFIVKQCFISKVAFLTLYLWRSLANENQLPLPWWFKANFIDVRLLLLQCIKKKKHGLGNDSQSVRRSGDLLLFSISSSIFQQGINERCTKRTLNISAQLKVLGLAEFEGRQHSGIDVRPSPLSNSSAPVRLTSPHRMPVISPGS